MPNWCSNYVTVTHNDIEYTFDGLEGLPETIVEIFNLNDMVEDSHDCEDCEICSHSCGVDETCEDCS